MSEAKEESSEKKAGLSPAQVLASALAAVTAAFLGSTLGVAGTVIGAGVASIVTTVGGELYLRSLRRTRAAARKTAELLAVSENRQQTRIIPPTAAPRSTHPLIRYQQNGAPQRRPATQLTDVQRPDVQRTRIVHPVSAPLSGTTRRIPMAGQGGSGSGEKTVFIPKPQDAGPETLAVGGDLEEPPSDGKKPWWKNRWTLIGATSVVAFVVGMLAITGFEAATGSTVSGGDGTTLGRVVGGSGKSVETTSTQVTTVTESSSADDEQAPATTSATPTESSSTEETESPVTTTAPSTSVPEEPSGASETVTTAPSSP
ncbi:hypothetical protein GCM10027445_49260 [Amycolatopsis endophytica]|uniref:Uncharacterized protein n=1 Tax=Amycolatopsis endophytica TaxID=860233 RepID=A0A853B2U4_9PSEU|nr:hypothetical protein [Amycolatopsis endophytica]NYI89145.1 hypothetical protein [Amycolatopsis endophytica]